MAHEEYGMKSATSEERGKRKSPRRLAEIRIKIGKGGTAKAGASVEHHHERSGMGMGGYIEPETHHFGAGQGAELKAHLMKHLGMSDGAEGGEEEAEE